MWQQIKNLFHLAQALTASIYFNFPSARLTVIAVTGTDGKTTTVSMIYHILNSAGKKVSMISSLGATVANKSHDTGYHVSTPGPWQIQKLLKKASNKGAEFFVIEATSHGIDQNRLAFVNVNTAVTTNVTKEHIDYHKNWKNYLKTKARLFKKVKISILNVDDPGSYTYLRKCASGKIITYSRKRSANYNLDKFPLKLKIFADYNVSNALAACAVAHTIGIPKHVILTSINQFEGVKGRLEEVNIGQQFKAIVDFAHTPNGLKSALLAIKKENPTSRIIAVFGSAGERDRAKRPRLGEVAATYADVSIITSEDPRSENPNKIIEEISRGYAKLGKIEKKDFHIVVDRTEAIKSAVTLARSGDVVAFFGKGHERSMNIGKKEYPWDEVETVKKAIVSKLNHAA